MLLFAAKQPPLTLLHFTGGDYPNYATGQLAEDHKSQASVKGFAERYVSLRAGAPYLMVSGKNFLHFFRSERMVLNMEDIVFVPFKSRDDHTDYRSSLYIQVATG